MLYWRRFQGVADFAEQGLALLALMAIDADLDQLVVPGP